MDNANRTKLDRQWIDISRGEIPHFTFSSYNVVEVETHFCVEVSHTKGGLEYYEQVQWSRILGE